MAILTCPFEPPKPPGCVKLSFSPSSVACGSPFSRAWICCCVVFLGVRRWSYFV